MRTLDNKNPIMQLNYKTLQTGLIHNYYTSNTLNLNRINQIIMMFINTTLALKAKRKIGEILAYHLIH